jgi:hypothetical protein
MLLGTEALYFPLPYTVSLGVVISPNIGSCGRRSISISVSIDTDLAHEVQCAYFPNITEQDRAHQKPYAC